MFLEFKKSRLNKLLKFVKTYGYKKEPKTFYFRLEFILDHGEFILDFIILKLDR